RASAVAGGPSAGTVRVVRRGTASDCRAGRAPRLAAARGGRAPAKPVQRGDRAFPAPSGRRDGGVGGTTGNFARPAGAGNDGRSASFRAAGDVRRRGRAGNPGLPAPAVFLTAAGDAPNQSLFGANRRTDQDPTHCLFA